MSNKLELQLRKGKRAVELLEKLKSTVIEISQFIDEVEDDTFYELLTGEEEEIYLGILCYGNDTINGVFDDLIHKYKGGSKPKNKEPEWHITIFSGFGVKDLALCGVEGPSHATGAGIVGSLQYGDFVKNHKCCPGCKDFAENNKDSLTEFLHKRKLDFVKKIRSKEVPI